MDDIMFYSFVLLVFLYPEFTNTLKPKTQSNTSFVTNVTISIAYVIVFSYAWGQILYEAINLSSITLAIFGSCIMFYLIALPVKYLLNVYKFLTTKQTVNNLENVLKNPQLPAA